MAIPSRVVSVDGEMATVECFGVTRSVSLMLMTEEVALGDLLIIQAGGFAVDKVDPQVGEEALSYLATILQASDSAA